MDGSIKTEYPEELADMIMFLSDIWMNPLVFEVSTQQLCNKARLLNQVLSPFGIQLFNDTMIEHLLSYREIICVDHDTDDKK